MLAKYWKKIGLIIVIIACVFNVMIKLINKLSLEKEMLASAQYVHEQNIEEDKEKSEQNNKQQAINQEENQKYQDQYDENYDQEERRNRNYNE